MRSPSPVLGTKKAAECIEKARLQDAPDLQRTGGGLIASISQICWNGWKSCQAQIGLVCSARTPNFEMAFPMGRELNGRPFVLGRDGRIYIIPVDAFVDDYPQLAGLLGATVSIAEDLGQAVLRFYDSCGVNRLSEAAILSRTHIGDTQEEPNRIGAKKTRRQLDSGIFRSALSALINREISERPGVDAEPLHSQPTASNSIADLRRLGVARLSTGRQKRDRSKPVTSGSVGTLYVVSPPTRTAFRDIVSYALAEAVTGSSGNARMLVSAIYRLLECNSTEEIADFLVENRGIPWQINLPFEAWEMERERQTGTRRTRSLEGESIAERDRGTR